MDNNNNQDQTNPVAAPTDTGMNQSSDAPATVTQTPESTVADPMAAPVSEPMSPSETPADGTMPQATETTVTGTDVPAAPEAPQEMGNTSPQVNPDVMGTGTDNTQE